MPISSNIIEYRFSHEAKCELFIIHGRRSIHDKTNNTTRLILDGGEGLKSSESDGLFAPVEK